MNQRRNYYRPGRDNGESFSARWNNNKEGIVSHSSRVVVTWRPEWARIEKFNKRRHFLGNRSRIEGVEKDRAANTTDRREKVSLSLSLHEIRGNPFEPHRKFTRRSVIRVHIPLPGLKPPPFFHSFTLFDRDR